MIDRAALVLVVLGAFTAGALLILMVSMWPLLHRLDLIAQELGKLRKLAGPEPRWRTFEQMIEGHPGRAHLGDVHEPPRPTRPGG